MQQREPKFHFGETGIEPPRLAAQGGARHRRRLLGVCRLLARLARRPGASGRWRRDRSRFGHRAWRGPSLRPGRHQPADGRRSRERQVAIGGHARSRPGGADGRLLCAGARRSARRICASALDPSYWRQNNIVAVVAGGASRGNRGRRHPCGARAGVRPALQGLPLCRAHRPDRCARRPRFCDRARADQPGAAEIAAAAVLAGSSLFVIANEGIANWQALLFAGLLLLLALTALRAKAAPG